MRHGSGETIHFRVDHLFAGDAQDARDLHTPECSSIWFADAGPLVVGDRYFVSTADGRDARRDTSIVYVAENGGGYHLVPMDGQPSALQPVMSLRGLVSLFAPRTLPPTSTARPSHAWDPGPILALVFGAVLLGGLRRTPRAARDPEA